MFARTNNFRKPRKPHFEPLEQRQLMSINAPEELVPPEIANEMVVCPVPLIQQATASLHEGTGAVSIRGTSYGDHVDVQKLDGDTLRVTVHGFDGPTQYDFALEQVRNLIFEGFGGDDEFSNLTDIKATIFGGDGDDYLLGGTGNDRIFGGDGNDALLDRGGRNVLMGEGGDDLIVNPGSGDVVDQNNETPAPGGNTGPGTSTNRAPSLTLPNQIVIKKGETRIPLVATDPDGDPLSYSAGATVTRGDIVEAMEFIAQNRHVKVTIEGNELVIRAEDLKGSLPFQIHVTASDDKTTTSQVISVSFAEVNTPTTETAQVTIGHNQGGFTLPLPKDGHTYQVQIVTNNGSQIPVTASIIGGNKFSLDFLRRRMHEKSGPIDNVRYIDREVAVRVQPGFVGKFSVVVTRDDGLVSTTDVTVELTKAVLLPDGTLVIDGTSGNDFVSVDEADGKVTVELLSPFGSATSEFNRGDVKSVVFRENGGQDLFFNSTDIESNTSDGLGNIEIGELPEFELPEFETPNVVPNPNLPSDNPPPTNSTTQPGSVEEQVIAEVEQLVKAMEEQLIAKTEPITKATAEAIEKLDQELTRQLEVLSATDAKLTEKIAELVGQVERIRERAGQARAASQAEFESIKGQIASYESELLGIIRGWEARERQLDDLIDEWNEWLENRIESIESWLDKAKKPLEEQLARLPDWAKGPIKIILDQIKKLEDRANDLIDEAHDTADHVIEDLKDQSREAHNTARRLTDELTATVAQKVTEATNRLNSAIDEIDRGIAGPIDALQKAIAEAQAAKEKLVQQVIATKEATTEKVNSLGEEAKRQIAEVRATLETQVAPQIAQLLAGGRLSFEQWSSERVYFAYRDFYVGLAKQSTVPIHLTPQGTHFQRLEKSGAVPKGVNIADIEWYFGVTVPTGMDAITFGNKVLVAAKYDPDSESLTELMSHELEHVSQYDRLGGEAEFADRYLGQVAGGIREAILHGDLHTLGMTPAQLVQGLEDQGFVFPMHDEVELEKEANEVEEAYTTWYSNTTEVIRGTSWR